MLNYMYTDLVNAITAIKCAEMSIHPTHAIKTITIIVIYYFKHVSTITRIIMFAHSSKKSRACHASSQVAWQLDG